MRKKAPVPPPVPTKVDFNKTVIFIKNSSREGPGAFESIAAERNIPIAVYDLEVGHPLPPAESVKSVVMLGGPESANADTPAMQAKVAFVKSIVERNVPYLGICLGMQILVKAVGGTVYKHALKEIGVTAPDRMPYTMAMTEAGVADRLFKGVDKTFPPVKAAAKCVIPVFQLHGETIAVPQENAELLATGIFCNNQALRVGTSAWGIQGHVEITLPLLERWATEDSDLKDHDRIGLIRALNLSSSEYAKAASMIFNNFLDISGF